MSQDDDLRAMGLDLEQEIENFYADAELADGLLRPRNSVQPALMVAEAARANTQSVGCHDRDSG